MGGKFQWCPGIGLAVGSHEPYELAIPHCQNWKMNEWVCVRHSFELDCALSMWEDIAAS